MKRRSTSKPLLRDFRTVLCAAIATMMLVGCRGESETPPAATAGSGASDTPNNHRTPQQWMRLVRMAANRGDRAETQSLIQQALIQHPESSDVWEFAGDLQRDQGKLDSAVEAYQTAKDLTAAGMPPSLSLLEKIARTRMAQSLPWQAVAGLQEMLTHYPKSVSARTELAGLLAKLGREHEAAVHLRWLVQRGHGSFGELIILSDLSRPQTDSSLCKAVLKRHPEDHRTEVPLAKLAGHFGRWSEVRARLQPALESGLNDPFASGLYGRAMVELGQQEQLQEWRSQLPEGIEQQPQYWLALAIHAQRNGNLRSAAYAFSQAIRLDEFDTEPLNRLAACLAELKSQEQLRTTILQRLSDITKLRRAVDGFAASGFQSPQLIVEIAQILDAMGRSWEAAAWLRAGVAVSSPADPALLELYREIRARLTAKTPWQRPEALLASQIDLDRFDPPSWEVATLPIDDQPASTQPSRLETSIIRWEDQAEERGLKHVCKINKPPGEEADLRIYQSIAGGVGVLDYDLNGWPDIYLTTMDGHPNQLDSGPNRLFRNCTGQFTDTTAFTDVGDQGFAQGVAVSDYNADGFPDLLVANIGANHFYLNNGDGTFQELSQQMGITGSRWTTSVAILDIDRDGYIDVFEVGYCAGEDAFTKECTRDGFTRSCSPLTFTSQRDRVWKGRQDGSFVDVSDSWLGEHSPGCGLAIVAGQFDESPGIDLYVANDMAANHFWSSHVQPNGEFRLLEQAAIRGLAVGARSLAQASMGIACGDPDADGDMDFFLTNHAGESNAYYQQMGPGVWVDQAAKVGLTAPSVAMLGFGTTWVDADNSGSLELAVANGHVDDFTHLGEPYRMPPQLFGRSVDGSWSEINADTLGSYFRTQRLGRNLVTTDVNRDGRMDLLVTHLFDPVSLLVNQTKDAHRSLVLYLKSRGGHPDSTGATVTVQNEQRKWVSQLVGGHGFQCSAQACLHFGLGSSDDPHAVSVQWVDGQIESFGELAGGEFLLIQGEGVAFPYERTP